MKKLFTLVALLAMVLGANAAEWKEDYKIDYSTKTAFPFYVMGYVPEWVNGVMTDYGSGFSYKTDEEMADFTGGTEVGTVTTESGAVYHKVQLDAPAWHQYFIADGINTGDLADVYVVKALVKASAACTINVNMGWGWGDGQQVGASVTIPQSDDFVEVEWQYSGIGGASCNLVAQGSHEATIEWKSLVVGHSQKASRPTVWKEWLTSDGQPVVVETTLAAIPTYMGNAETPWADPNVKFDDKTKNYLICAWGKQKGTNMNDDGGSDPFPATIEEVDGSHVFVVHGALADSKDADGSDAPSAWDNQFWIQSPQAWKAGEQVKIHFRYKASQAAKTNTQIHKQNPSDYLIWHAIGDITFSTEWQEFDGTMSIADDMAEGWSIAFNLNAEVKEPTDFYFDDLSWQTMVLDEGYFVAGCNKGTGLAYDYDSAIQFEEVTGQDDYNYVATVGEKNAYVDEIMISTVRGNDAAFKGHTIKVSEDLTTDPEDWKDYTEAAQAKIALPGSGIWKVYLDTESKTIAVEMIEGDVIVLKDIVTNPTEITVKALEREYTEAEAEAAGIDKPETPGQAWDNQFWIIANRVLDAGEETVIVFDYKATKEAKASTQCHAAPGGYISGAFDNVNFTTEWQTFTKEFTIPDACAGKNMQSIAFNLAEIKEANDYSIKNVKWYLKSNEEGKTRDNLIWAEGDAIYAYKVVGGAITTGIKEVATKKASSNVMYNLAGQRV
ncbi:MAG: hypothetical protein K6F43_06195, partial [Prevotella sp.]|nr:hypothetical protein [Prevotella sp.]